MTENIFTKNQPIDWTAHELDLNTIPDGLTYGAIDIFEDRIGRRLELPVIVAKNGEGPIFGITAAVHGNEINGIPTIHQLFSNIDIGKLQGVLVAIPIVNLPGYLAYSREFIDGVDLNRIMPGKNPGTPSEIYANLFVHKILSKFEFHLDLHTASFGRINSHYIRVDISHSKLAEMLELIHADIIVHATGPANSVRQHAMDMGIPSMTIELGNPQVFQPQIIEQACQSIQNIMSKIGLLALPISLPEKKPVICKKSYWLRVHDGGILKVHPKLVEIIEKDQIIATMSDIYGRKEIEYHCPEKGIVVGKNVNPVVSTGDRILHLGIMKD